MRLDLDGVTGAVTVQYRCYHHDDELEPNTYTCPWCGEENAYRAPGAIAWVTCGHYAAGTKAQ